VSNHYLPAGASAIDTGLINGKRPSSSNCQTQRFQAGMEKTSTIRENYGPSIKNKNNKPKNVGSHKTWIHTSFRKK